MTFISTMYNSTIKIIPNIDAYKHILQYLSFTDLTPLAQTNSSWLTVVEDYYRDIVKRRRYIDRGLRDADEDIRVEYSVDKYRRASHYDKNYITVVISKRFNNHIHTKTFKYIVEEPTINYLTLNPLDNNSMYLLSYTESINNVVMYSRILCESSLDIINNYNDDVFMYQQVYRLKYGYIEKRLYPYYEEYDVVCKVKALGIYNSSNELLLLENYDEYGNVRYSRCRGTTRTKNREIIVSAINNIVNIVDTKFYYDGMIRQIRHSIYTYESGMNMEYVENINCDDILDLDVEPLSMRTINKVWSNDGELIFESIETMIYDKDIRDYYTNEVIVLNKYNYKYLSELMIEQLYDIMRENGIEYDERYSKIMVINKIVNTIGNGVIVRFG